MADIPICDTINTSTITKKTIYKSVESANKKLSFCLLSDVETDKSIAILSQSV